MNSITIPAKDKGYNINFNVTYANAVAINWNGYTVNIKTWAPTAPGTLLVNKSCTAVNADAGLFVYTIASGDFNTVGTYYAELEATKTGVQESTETFKLLVGESG